MEFVIQIVLIIVGIAVVGILLLLLAKKTRERAAGICAAAIGLTALKNANKEKALALIAEKKEMSNADIRQALGVSERTAVRYMDELEKEGRVEQVGDTGRGVQYRLKQ